MTVNRVGTFAQNQLSVSVALNNQRLLGEKQIQLSSGKASLDYAGIARDSSRLVSVENELVRTQQYKENIQVTQKRLSLMDFSVNSIHELTRDARSLLTSANSGDKAFIENDLALPTQMANMRDQVVELLNIRDDSRYLFAGGRTDQRPVDLANGVYTAPSPPPLETSADAGYYGGDNVQHSVRADKGFTVQYGITADNTAFEKVVRVLDTMARMTFSEPTTAAERKVIDDAFGVLTTALGELEDMGSKIALNVRTLEQVDERHDRFIDHTKSTIGDIEEVDASKTIVELNALNFQIEASYTSLARLQKLSLLNFL